MYLPKIINQLSISLIQTIEIDTDTLFGYKNSFRRSIMSLCFKNIRVLWISSSLQQEMNGVS